MTHPSLTQITWSAAFCARSTSCSDATTAMPRSRASRRRRRSTSSCDRTSRYDVGSSSSSTRGSWQRARARRTRCRCPSLTCAKSRSASASTPVALMAAVTAASSFSPSTPSRPVNGWRPASTTSRQVRSSVWGRPVSMTDMVRARSVAGTSGRSRPSSSTVPPRARSWPATVRRIVVLPEPLGPISATTWPGRTARQTSRTSARRPCPTSSPRSSSRLSVSLIGASRGA